MVGLSMRPAEREQEADTVSLVVNDEPASVARFRATVEAVAREHGLSPDATFALKVATSEALTNALKAAAGEGVSVDVSLEGDAGAIQVEVLGPGQFRLIDGRDPERGRGLPLMVALSDEVEFARTDDGMRVRIRMRVVHESD